LTQHPTISRITLGAWWDRGGQAGGRREFDKTELVSSAQAYDRERKKRREKEKIARRRSGERERETGSPRHSASRASFATAANGPESGGNRISRRCAAVNPSFASIHRPPWTICYADKRGAARVQILHSAGRIVAAVERDRRRNEKGDMDRLRAERNSRTVHCPCLALYVAGHVRDEGRGIGAKQWARCLGVRY